MKRSNSLMLCLMATGAVVALTACDETPPPEPAVSADMYTSVEECVSGGKYTESYCKSSFDKAKQQHAASAPRYDSKTLCEEQFGPGACQMGPTAAAQANAGGDFWTPFLMGYVVSSALDDLGDAMSAGSHRDRDRQYGGYAAPVYRSSSGGWHTPSGSMISSTGSYAAGKGASVSVPKSSITKAPPPATVQTRTTVVSRGGFSGPSSSGFSSGG